MSATAPAATMLVGAKVDPALKRSLAELARLNERNVSQEIRLALRRHVDRELATSRDDATA
jgi:predicted transcriptional regulator